MAVSSSKEAREGGVRAGRRVKMASLRRWVRRALVKGLTRAELVFELHVRRGLKLRKVAKVLRLGLGEVREHWWKIRMARAALAPKRERVLPPLAPRSEEDVVSLREQVCVALWETVVETFALMPEVKASAGEVDEKVGKPVSQSMMRVRMRALRQMGRLYGVGGKKRGSAKRDAVPERCATPEEIAEAVRAREAGAGRALRQGSESSRSQPGRRCEAIA